MLVRMTTNKEITEAARILSGLEPGFLPFPIFEQVARLSTLPIVEIVPLRQNARGEVEVLLLPRHAVDDLAIFKDNLHTPGVVVRPSDTSGSFEDAFRRILQDELQGLACSEPTYVTHILHNSGRGLEAAQIYWVEVLEEPIVGAFYTADELPASTMQSQFDFIPTAVAHYRTTLGTHADPLSTQLTSA